MKEKMTLGGVGPGIALISLPYTLLAIYVHNSSPTLPQMSFLTPFLSKAIGFTLIILGLLFYLATIYVFMADFKKQILITRGPYKWCRNPIYATWIVFVIPGLAILFHSLIILSIAVVVYINFKAAIHGEYRVLRQNFGDSYEVYEKSVNELFPFPRF